MLSAYFDDSGTHDTSSAVVIAGLLGTDTQWKGFERAWRNQLKAPLPGKPALRRFHIFDCNARVGEFENYTAAECDVVIKAFRDIIIQSNVIGYAVGVDRSAWAQTVARSEIAEQVGDEELFAAAYCVLWARHETINRPRHDQVGIVFDLRKHRSDANSRIFEYMQKELSFDELAGIAFARSINVLPLQAADMWAWESYRLTIDWIASQSARPRPHLARFHETGRYQHEVLDHASCDFFLEGARRTSG